MKPRLRGVLFNDLVDDVPPEQWKECFRASGKALCSCGEILDKHYQPMKKTCPTIVEDCEGTWWKL